MRKMGHCHESNNVFREFCESFTDEFQCVCDELLLRCSFYCYCNMCGSKVIPMFMRVWLGLLTIHHLPSLPPYEARYTT